MTDNEKNILKGLLIIQNSILDQIPVILKVIIQQRTQNLSLIEGVGKFMNLMIDVEDRDQRKLLFERLWSEVSDSDVQMQLDKMRAKLETQHDTLSAHIQSFLSDLDNP